jgi:Kef-type K+ transport system membrane component KefB
MDLNAYPILRGLIIATASSILAALPLRFRVPIVLWEKIFGMIVGPHLVGWARLLGRFTMVGERVGTYTLLRERGLAALFFMAGLDLNLTRVQGRPRQLAIAGWVISLGGGLAAAVLWRVLPFVHALLMIVLALTTTQGERSCLPCTMQACANLILVLMFSPLAPITAFKWATRD